uniref:EGF-like domain-containing protein n=2 Tax=Chenopodium quinoa TaxID=63459 RepID=A0A803LBF5_CHEQI
MTMFTAPKITQPGCPRKCGNLTVPYPFGVGLGGNCSRGLWYDVFCMTSYDPPKAFLIPAEDTLKKGIEILDISETHIRLKNQIGYICFNSTNVISPRFADMINFVLLTKASPYSVSGTTNKFFAVGCNDYFTVSGSITNDPSFFIISGDGGKSCRTKCSTGAKDVVAGECNGIGCCQSTIPNGIRSYEMHEYNSNHTNISSYNPCGYSFVADHESFKFRGLPDLDDPNFINRTMYDAPLVLDWAISNVTCANARRNRDTYECKGNTSCVNADDSGIGGYRCKCLPGYEGNPYLSPGCS